MSTRVIRLPLCCILILGLAACAKGHQNAPAAQADFASRFSSTHFLQFFNRQPSLAAGSYTLVAATQQPQQSGSFTLQVGFDDGSSKTFQGSWTASGGPSPTAAGNPAFTVTLDLPGGLSASLNAAVPTQLYLLDRAGNVVAQGAAGGSGTVASIRLPGSQTDDVSYPTGYYKTIDLNSNRDTLTKWKQLNGFDAGDTAHVIFRDAVDLGYGRDIHMRRRADGGIAVYVQNFQVSNLSGQTPYGPLNLDAAIDQDPQYHVGTNALEWGPLDLDGDGQPDDLNGDGSVGPDDYVVQFFTFDTRPPYARKLAVNFDGEGDKAMPVPCLTCHGGRADPLLLDGSFPHQGDARGHLQPLDLDRFEFSSRSGYTRADLEAGLKQINQAVYDSYAASLPPSNPTTPQANRWYSTEARALLEGWYGGAGLPNASFNGSFVQSGWQPDPSSSTAPPAGADHLLQDVEGVYCRSCHLLRGSNGQSDLDFASYSKFVGFSAETQFRVYDQGEMPLALLQSDLFFGSPTLPQELASFLTGFSDFGSSGAVNLPGRPIALAGPTYTGPSPVALSGGASLFAAQYSWSIVSAPSGAHASFDNPAGVRPTLTADTDGAYVIQLTVSDGSTTSAPSSVTVNINSALARPPAQLTFDADIRPILQGTDPVHHGDCVQCHSPATGNAFIPPIYYTDPAAGENRNLYQEVRARVNLLDPERSPLLVKPSGHHHGGDTVAGFDLSGDHSSYDIFLAWIAAGAREQ